MSSSSAESSSFDVAGRKVKLIVKLLLMEFVTRLLSFLTFFVLQLRFLIFLFPAFENM